MFLEFDVEWQSNTSEVARLAKALSYWRNPKRRMVDAFVKSWVDVATLKANDALPQIDRRSLAIEAVRSFHRVRALSPDDNAMLPALAVVSQYHALIENALKDTPFSEIVQDAIVSNEKAASEFRDQRSMRMPTAHDSRSRWVAGLSSWASRRLDVAPVRSWIVGSGVDALIKQMSGMDLKQYKSSFYYSPLGGRLSALPSNSAFAIDDLAHRLLWLQHMIDACSNIIHVVDAATRIASVSGRKYSIRTATFENPKAADLKLSGLSRHPLAMTSKDEEIQLYLAAPVVLTSTAGEAPNTISEALRLVYKDAGATSALPKASLAMRVIAYNADRLLNAIDLALATKAGTAALEIHFNEPQHVLSLCIAVAMLAVEKPTLQPEFRVHVAREFEEPGRTTELLERVVATCSKAVDKGCKVVSLAEAAVCFA